MPDVTRQDTKQANPTDTAEVALSHLETKLDDSTGAKQPAGPLSLKTLSQSTDAGMPGWPKIAGFEILQALGEGGMGAVYRARDIGLDRPVALKVIREGMATAEQRSRFLVEARAVAKLHHPNIVQIYAVNEWQPVEGGPALPYLALEYVEGGDLESLAGASPMDPHEAAQIVLQLARGMSHAHSKGIIHRDLKPANVLMGIPDLEARRAGNSAIPKIADFGLARQQQSEQKLTATGAVMGTPAYMSPEQADGFEVGPATDIYALGAILYRLLTGQVCFKGKSVVDTLFRVCKEPPVPPRQICPQIPAELEAICLRCLAKEPADRYPDAATLADELESFLAEPEESQTLLLPPRSAAARAPSRWHPLHIGIAASIVAVVGLGVWLGQKSMRDTTAPKNPETRAAIAEAIKPSEPVRVQLLQVEHYRIKPDRNRSEPPVLIGKESASARFNDGVVLKVGLTEPAYFYLLAFNANGKEDLLWPCDDGNQPLPKMAPPKQEQLPRFPVGTAFLYLDDEPAGGEQVFVVVASREPLPSYEEWRRRRSAVAWSRLPPQTGVWRATEQITELVRPDVGATRGVKEAIGVPPLAELCRSLKSGGVEAVEAVGFPVEAKP